MPVVNQYLAFGTANGANTYPFATYNTSPERSNGYVAGTADAQHVNTALRQCSVGVAGVAKFSSDYGTINVNDDGSPATFAAALKSALDALYASTSSAVMTKLGNLFVGDYTSISATMTVTFPVPFPTACTQVFCQVKGTSASSVCCVQSISATGFTFNLREMGSDLQNDTVQWVAYGN